MRRGACVVLIAVGWGLFVSPAGAGPEDVCHVGAQLHLRLAGTPEQSYLRHLRAFIEADMADYALLCAQGLSDEDRDRAVRYLAKHKVHFLLQEELISHKNGEIQQKPRRYCDRQDLDRTRAIAGDLFLGVHWGELDSTGVKPEDYLPADAHDNPSRRQVKEALLDYLRTRVEGYHTEFATPFAHSSAVLSHGLFAEAGFDILCSEIGENIPNVNMMVASNRGAARAYGRPWMIDHSTWWAPRGHAGEQVSPREGHTPWCLFTTLLSAAMGGADYVQLEVDWAAYDKEFNRLRPWGRAMKTLYALTRLAGPRGDTVTRFAVLLGHENGWPGVGWRIGDVRGTGLFDGIRHQFMQTREADLSLKIFDVFYPGFERCGWDPEYPGFLAESPLGTLDIVTDNLPLGTPSTSSASANPYNRYAVLVALGYHRMTELLRKTLRQYVEQGGVLVCGDSLFLDEAEKPVAPAIAEPLIGCTYDAGENRLIHLYQPKAVLDAIDGYAAAAERDEWDNHWLHPATLTSGRVAARFDDVPYLIENRIGKGRVFFVTALNMVGSGTTKRGQEPFLYANILSHFLHSLEQHIGDGIQFSPWTSLEHIANIRSDGTTLLLVMNHGDMPYRRDAIMANLHGYTTAKTLAQGTWEGYTSGPEVKFDQTGERLAWSFDMAPKSFALFEFGK